MSDQIRDRRNRTKFRLLRLIVVACCMSIGARAQDSSAAATPTSPQSPKAQQLEALETYNELIKAQIEIFTNQQKLAGLYFPAVPPRPEPNVTREGVPLLKGNVAAYQKLEQIAKVIAADVAGRKIDEAQVCGKYARDKEKRAICADVFEALGSQIKGKDTKTSDTGIDIKADKGIWLEGQKEVAALFELQANWVQLDLLKKKLDEALGEPRGIGASQPMMSNESGGGIAFGAAIGPAVQLANGLFNYFRKKTTISSIGTDTNEMGIASMLREVGFPKVYFASNFPPGLKVNQSESHTISKLNEIRKLIQTVSGRIKTESDEKVLRQKDANKVSEEVLTSVAKATRLGEEIKHLEALHKASSGAISERLEKMLNDKRNEKVAADSETGKKRLIFSEADAMVKSKDAEISQWAELQKAMERAIAEFGETEGSEGFMGRILRAESILKRMEAGSRVLQVHVQMAGAEVSGTNRMGNVSESSQGGAIVSYLLIDALNGNVEKSRTVAVGPDGTTKP
jgi:hypothetical protein